MLEEILDFDDRRGKPTKYIKCLGYVRHQKTFYEILGLREFCYSELEVIQTRDPLIPSVGVFIGSRNQVKRLRVL